MPEDFVADVQYGDLKGTIALDGHDGPTIHLLEEFAEVPPGYMPVGFASFGVALGTDNKAADYIPFDLACVRVADVGATIMAVHDYLKTHDTLPVYMFPGKLPPRQLMRLFKRISIKVLTRDLDPARVIMTPLDDE